MNRLQLLDYGRFTAALSVIAFHYTFNGIHNGKISSLEHIDGLITITRHGHYGVEFFFMISGFVIFFSAQNKKASQFAASRFKRLYPTFWVAILFTSLFAYLWGQGTSMQVNPKQILANLTMLPSLFGQKDVDGVYWTLLWELKFYLLVFIVLLAGFGEKLENLFIAWSYYLLITHLFHLDLAYSGKFYAFFVGGALFALNKSKYSIKVLLPLAICFTLSVLNADKNSTNIFSPSLLILVSMFYLFFIVLTLPGSSKLNLYKSSLLGALTYPMYLIHAHFGYMFLSRYANESNKYLLYPLLLLIVLTISYLINYFIEIKLSKFWYLFFRKTVERPVSVLEEKISRYTGRSKSLE